MAILELRPVFKSYVHVGFNTGRVGWDTCLRPASSNWEPTGPDAQYGGQATTGVTVVSDGGAPSGEYAQFQVQYHYDVSAITPFLGPIKYTRTFGVDAHAIYDQQLAFCFGLQSPVLDVHAYWPEVIRDCRTVHVTTDLPAIVNQQRWTEDIPETSWEGTYLACVDVHHSIISEIAPAWVGSIHTVGLHAYAEDNAWGSGDDPVLTVNESDNLLGERSNVLFGAFPI